MKQLYFKSCRQPLNSLRPPPGHSKDPPFLLLIAEHNAMPSRLGQPGTTLQKHSVAADLLQLGKKRFLYLINKHPLYRSFWNGPPWDTRHVCTPL